MFFAVTGAAYIVQSTLVKRYEKFLIDAELTHAWNRLTR